MRGMTQGGEERVIEGCVCCRMSRMEVHEARGNVEMCWR